MSDSIKSVKAFYDDFNNNKTVSRLNLRHYFLLKTILSFGLNSKSKVLEIGCGSGQLSKKIIPLLKSGSFTGTDISSKCIDDLNYRFKSNSNVSFFYSDSTSLPFPNDSFDFVVLADVLEHIPQKIHGKLFHEIFRITSSEAKIFINIPTKEYIHWQKNNAPHELQIIDQELSSISIISPASDAGLNLLSCQKYSLFHQLFDYEWFLFNKPRSGDYPFRKLPASKISIRKLYNRLIFTFNNLV